MWAVQNLPPRDARVAREEDAVMQRILREAHTCIPNSDHEARSSEGRSEMRQLQEAGFASFHIFTACERLS